LTSDGGQAVVGEFRMVLRKVNGSLGFTLQSTDETVLKHTVKVGQPVLWNRNYLLRFRFRFRF
jgi:hypothetical protein